MDDVLTVMDISRFEGAFPGSVSRLTEIASEVRQIAAVLASLAEESGFKNIGDEVTDVKLEVGEDLSFANMLVRLRRLRGQFFPDEIFADPAWDMLLDLYTAELENRLVAVSSLCIASATPPTTALRWIRNLTDAGLFKRVSDQSDGRRVFIELTDVATSGMRAYLSAAKRLLMRDERSS